MGVFSHLPWALILSTVFFVAFGAVVVIYERRRDRKAKSRLKKIEDRLPEVAFIAQERYKRKYGSPHPQLESSYPSAAASPRPAR
jgi:hypothetical protein